MAKLVGGGGATQPRLSLSRDDRITWFLAKFAAFSSRFKGLFKMNDVSQLKLQTKVTGGLYG